MCMASTVSSALRRVLVLGSGFTSAPLVECLTREGRIAVTVGMLGYADTECITFVLQTLCCYDVCVLLKSSHIKDNTLFQKVWGGALYNPWLYKYSVTKLEMFCC